MAQKLLVPIYVPSWLSGPLVRAKRALIPQAEVRRPLNIKGERNIEWSFITAEMPDGPGEALEFGCENGYISLLAAEKGFHVIANDLEEQKFTWTHPRVDFRQGDFLKLDLPSNHFDLVINCSSVEHVGIAGRYGVKVDDSEGDLEVMRRLAQILKPCGCFLMTVPCGQDTIMKPWCRVYGHRRLPLLLGHTEVRKERYWIKNSRNQWTECDRSSALSFEPKYAGDPYSCLYALAGFVLSKQ